jgi:hypothetical protein
LGAEEGELDGVHLSTAYLGVLIGGITFTGEFYYIFTSVSGFVAGLAIGHESVGEERDPHRYHKRWLKGRIKRGFVVQEKRSATKDTA